MKWLKWLLIGVAALLLLFAAVSLALPAQFRIERSVAIAVPAEKVNRWFGLFMDRPVGLEFKAGLNNLTRLAEGS